MLMLGIGKKKTNWDVLQGQKFGDTASTRDVHGQQIFDRGDAHTVSNQWPRRILAIVAALFFGAMAFIGGLILSIAFQLFTMITSGESFLDFTLDPSAGLSDWRVWVFSGATVVLSGLVMHERMMAGWKSENAMADTTDINPHKNDQHLALIPELQKTLDWFPDAGAHSSVQMTSMLSHVMVSNKGVKMVEVSKRHKEKGVGDDGQPVFKGSLVKDENGETVFSKKKLFDESFGQDLLTASGIPRSAKSVRGTYDVRNIPYNPPDEGEEKKENPKRIDREKLDYDTVVDAINADWVIPEFEVQRPAGAYLVDTSPSNTMVLAITRGGKGQTVIEPTIDMWTREKRQNNIVINDPKGELLVKFYVPATVRGYEIVQFNLINPMKTDIYNPIGFAAGFAREGDYTKAASYIENIGDVFFPKDGGDDPMWPNAANNAFKRTIFGLIDYYLEEEKQIRRVAEVDGTGEKVLAQRLDDLWGKVSLYNAYQLFVVLSSKKSTDEEFIKIDDDEEVKEKDYLTLFFDATAKLPINSMRTLVSNSDRSLRAMAGSDKTIASVYGIALTAMSFFTDPTISTLTSGKPSQNFDAQGLSFPRRIGVQFAPEWLKKRPMVGMESVWTAYKDAEFTDQYDNKIFGHTQLVDRTGWARYYFDGIFPKKTAYIKLEIKNPDTDALLKTFYFEMELTYKTSLNGRSYVKDPILKKKIIRDGVLREMQRRNDGSFHFKETLVIRRYRNLTEENPVEKQIKVPVFTQKSVNYTERPKAVFFITPPHLMAYAKLILILIKQMVDVNFESAYITKDNQKPLYKTRYMLDELGNLQSEGNGIPALQTMLSIGLGQDQQFTLILQTLQQLRDVYGESVDKIIQGNVANIVFLKSTDDTMIEMLEKLSGKTHVSLIEQKTITRDNERMMAKNEGRISYTMSTTERSVIQFNDMMFIKSQNSMVFRAGDSPIWNHNEAALPMSWRLHANQIVQPGARKYSLQTVPTLSSALDFDVRKNQPNFFAMLDKRLKQARIVDYMRARYMDVYDYEEEHMALLDPDVLSDELMIAINQQLYGTGIDSKEVGHWVDKGFDTEDEWKADCVKRAQQEEDDLRNAAVDNTDVIEEVEKRGNVEKEANIKIYANGRISKRMLVDGRGNGVLELGTVIAEAYEECVSFFAKEKDYKFNPNTQGLRKIKENVVYVEPVSQIDKEALEKAITDESSTTYSEEGKLEDMHLCKFKVTPAFMEHLASLPSWKHIAGGRFDHQVARIYTRTKMIESDENEEDI